MVWFRIDDAFDDHPKVLAAGNAAIGLWTRCGAYSSRYLLDGFVPDVVARSKGTRGDIRRLVDAGLWHPTDGGYRMHDFLDWNPSAEQVTAERARNAERQARHRTRHTPASNAVTHTATNDAPSRPVPTRPIGVPTQESSSVATPGAATDDDGFAHVLELVVAAKVAERHPRNPRAYAMTVRTNTVEDDGELIRRLLADGTDPELVALFVLGHGHDAIPHRTTTTIAWCGPECSECSGDAWVDTGAGLAPCPNRTTDRTAP